MAMDREPTKYFKTRLIFENLCLLHLLNNHRLKNQFQKMSAKLLTRTYSLDGILDVGYLKYHNLNLNLNFLSFFFFYQPWWLSLLERSVIILIICKQWFESRSGLRYRSSKIRNNFLLFKQQDGWQCLRYRTQLGAC